MSPASSRASGRWGDAARRAEGHRQGDRYGDDVPRLNGGYCYTEGQIEPSPPLKVAAAAPDAAPGERLRRV
jgi:hypothetical protein